MGELFQPTRPLRGATMQSYDAQIIKVISTHAPLAGRDQMEHGSKGKSSISTHAPLAGRDRWATS